MEAYNTIIFVEETLILLAILAYIGINFVADLPKFLIAENITLALLYIMSLVAVEKNYSWSQPFTLLLSAFNAGRVSRSIISPRGELQERAIQHIPLLILILTISFSALASLLV
jgi:hypothetical protein